MLFLLSRSYKFCLAWWLWTMLILIPAGWTWGGVMAFCCGTWLVLVSFRAGVTVPMGVLMKASGEYCFKLSFSQASAGGNFGAQCSAACGSSASLWYLALSLWFGEEHLSAKAFHSFSWASERPIFFQESNLSWKMVMLLADWGGSASSLHEIQYLQFLVWCWATSPSTFFLPMAEANSTPPLYSP